MNEKLYMKLRNTLALRIILWPVENLRRIVLLGTYALSKDSKFVKTLHNKHVSQRCFIIGNGPSLQPEDLDKLKDEYTFAANRIYYIYPKTVWRPTYYLCCDECALVAELDRIKASGDYIKFVNFKSRFRGRDSKENLWYLCFKGLFRLNPYKLNAKTLSSDLSKYSASVGTITVTAAELAIYMGFKDIYFLGVDNSYSRTVDKNGKFHDDKTVKVSYFNGMKNGEGKDANERGTAFAQPVDFVNQSYDLLKEFANIKNVKIYNATRGGKLEVFERVDFDSLFV